MKRDSILVKIMQQADGSIVVLREPWDDDTLRDPPSAGLQNAWNSAESALDALNCKFMLYQRTLPAKEKPDA